MSRPAACLFDLDGLLLDTEPLHASAWRQAARHFGRDLSEAELVLLRGRRRLDCAHQVRNWIRENQGQVPSVEELLVVRQPIAEALLVRAAAIDGAPELLQRCRQLEIPMALVTSSARSSVALKSGPHPWLDVIVVRIHGDDPELQAGKPAPDPFLLAARRLGVEPARCWAFEDSLAGAAAAAAAGCQVVVLLHGGIDARRFPAGSHCLRSLREVKMD
ncbi:HAD family phosphatase [Cyanobium sp. ATX 6A2]|uniref:HAD family hydrolase n=1 Tax=Cyanobium sp. ATX 6A2 TaxID=2823700 RepID=UPI0020CE517D|nr:HAD family phosphatase [Cyanobium sp. ATX 6A2]MCP9888773.1 HAD family phosphatase [Cyanobium sp. ATX 6A2]